MKVVEVDYCNDCSTTISAKRGYNMSMRAPTAIYEKINKTLHINLSFKCNSHYTDAELQTKSKQKKKTASPHLPGRLFFCAANAAFL